MSLIAVSKALPLVTGQERASTSLGHLLVRVGVLLWSSVWVQRGLGASGHKGAEDCRPSEKSATMSTCRMTAWHDAAPIPLHTSLLGGLTVMLTSLCLWTLFSILQPGYLLVQASAYFCLTIFAFLGISYLLILRWAKLP